MKALNANSREKVCGGAGTTKIQHPAAYASYIIERKSHSQRFMQEKPKFCEWIATGIDGKRPLVPLRDGIREDLAVSDG